MARAPNDPRFFLAGLILPAFASVLIPYPAPMTRITCFIIVAALSCALCAWSRGDTVVLKSGEKIEGKILSDTDAEVKIETKAGGIVDERTVPKSEIAKVEKATPDGLAWQPLKTVQPGANSLPAGQYERALAPLRAFVAQYPQSVHAAEAQKALTAFEEEKKRVDAGELKLNQKWISKEEVQKERYQINALVALNYLREQQARGDVIGALNTFDILERDYPGSKAYPDAVEAVLRILPTLKAQAAARVAAFPAEKADQEKRIAAALEPSKTDMKAAGEREKATNEATLAAARKSGVKWMPLLLKSDEAMKQIAEHASSEQGRLAGLDLTKLRQSVQLAEKAQQALATNDLPAAEESVIQAQNLWDANELAKRVNVQLAAAKAATAEEPLAPPPPEAKSALDPAAPDTSASSGSSASTEPVSSDDAPAVAEEDTTPLITPVRVVVTVLVIAFLVAMWKTYKTIKSKASDVLE